MVGWVAVASRQQASSTVLYSNRQYCYCRVEVNVCNNLSQQYNLTYSNRKQKEGLVPKDKHKFNNSITQTYDAS